MHNPASSSSLRSRLNSALSGLSEQLPAIGSIQHSLRQQVVTHNPNQNPETLKLQLAITAQSAVVRDEEALVREQQAASKAVFLWGQSQKDSPEVVDVTDRLGFLLYSTGEQFAAHARALEQSRAAMKDIRNLENDLVPRRRAHAALMTKLSALESANRQRDASTIASLRAELVNSQLELETFEASLGTVRRRKLGEGFSLQFAAQRELGEKLAIIAAYGEVLLQALQGMDHHEKYDAQEHTAAVRLEAAEAIKSWSASKAFVRTPTVGASGQSSLGRSDTRSFGSTHADALSHIGDPATSEKLDSAHALSPRVDSLSPDHPPSAAQPAAVQAATVTAAPSSTYAACPAALAPSASASGITRMATTDRRRLQHSEKEIGTAEEGEIVGSGGERLPQYELMAAGECPDERERIEAELVEVRRREAKQAAARAGQ